MKLWLKISLIAIIMVTAATSICSLIMLISSGRSNLDNAVQSALTRQQVRAASWREAMESNIDSQYGPVAQRSLARYLIGKFADKNTILVSNDDSINNTTSIDPGNYLSAEDEAQQYIIQDIAGSTILIAGSSMQVNDTPYTLYVIEDISYVYDGVNVLSRRFALINLAVVLCAGGVITALVLMVLRPVAALRENTALIASGIYDRRVDAAGDDEIAELAAHFNSMADAVEGHVRELRDEADRRTLFMSALTHELKTPMTSISGNAQTLMRTKMDDDERADALLRIDSECTRIERLSQKMMQLIVLHQNNSILPAPVKITELLEDVRISCSEMMEQRGLALKTSCGIDTLVMDKDLIMSLLLNLIDNAGKASQPGDVIELTAEDTTIAVRDHGKGIPEEELDKITQPFYMVDKSRSKKAGGIGLGLALAAEIARLHGAELQFESELGTGTTAKVVFQA